MTTPNKSAPDARQAGSALILTLVTAILLGFLMTFILVQGQVEARAARFRLASMRALYESFGKLETARVLVANATYDAWGRNLIVLEALEAPNRTIPGTDVTIEPMTGSGGSWYLLVARAPFEGAERVVRQAFRDKDYFSSYNLFVSDDPAGICGSPIGAIHTNRQLQFYFPNGLYRHAVTAAEGALFRAGATEENTTIAGPFNAHADPISLDLDEHEGFNLASIERSALPSFRFPADKDVRIKLKRQRGVQRVEVVIYSKPRIEERPKQVVAGYRNVNPHSVEYEVEERVIAGYETKTRTRRVFDHYEDVPRTVRVPIYREVTEYVQVPVYRKEERTRQVPVYGYVTKTRRVKKRVWVWDDSSRNGGTAIGGDGGRTGHYEWKRVDESYREKVVTGTREETYYVDVVDHCKSVPRKKRVIDHYEERVEMGREKVYRDVVETYRVPKYKEVERKKTKIVYDREPIYKTVIQKVYHKRKRLGEFKGPAPSNGLIFVGGDCIALEGDVVGRLTIAAEGEIRITGNLVYRDAEGDPAYRNGTKPDRPYEPNPDYDNRAALGLIARKNVLYTEKVPKRFEVNASILAIEGRVGIEGVVLDDDGEVVAYNRFTDEFKRKKKGKFEKDSIRRLGGITTCRRPVDTVVDRGRIAAGFRRGASAFDASIVEGPPPYFLSYPTPRFFATQILR